MLLAWMYTAVIALILYFVCESVIKKRDDSIEVSPAVTSPVVQQTDNTVKNNQTRNCDILHSFKFHHTSRNLPEIYTHVKTRHLVITEAIVANEHKCIEVHLVTFVIRRYDQLDSLKFQMKFTINKQWDSKHTGHDPIEVTLTSSGNGVTMKVEGPFFNDPPSPPTPPGEPAPQLWDYEGKRTKVQYTIQ